MSTDPEQTQDLEATTLVQKDLPLRSAHETPDFPRPEDLASLLPEGAYHVEGVLGRGGMGTVYKGRQIRLQRPVAIKIMRREQGRDFDFEQRFRREALALAALNHPNIVSVIDHGEAGPEYLYIVMEFVDGADLMDAIRSGRMTQEMTLALLPQICDALQFAHEHGIVHRDIKPSNIMLTRDGRVKMADFGLVKRIDVENTFVTRTGVSMGTPDYAAPEQFDLAMNIDHRADIYALGVMIYQMLTGHLPRGAWRPPSQRAEVASQWDEIVSQATQADPKDRYQSAREIKTDISTISLAEKSPQILRSRTSSQGRSRSIVLPATVGVLALAGAAFYALKKPSGLPEAANKMSGKEGGQESALGGYHVIKIGAKAEDLRKANSSQTVHDVLWKEGVLSIGQTAGKGQIYDYRPIARDAILRAEVRFNPASSSPQLCLRNQGGGNSGTFYRLWSDIQDRSLKLAFVEGWNGYTLFQKWSFPAGKASGDWLAMELRTIGDQITAVVDGQVLGSFTHKGISKPGGYQIFTLGHSDFRHVEYIILDAAPTPSSATKDAPFVNSLGMKFVPVPVTGGPTDGKRILFSIWETRERDYEVFVKATERKWSKDASVTHEPDFPAASTCWEDAQAFCVWLTERERSTGKLKANETYRLPSDHEWSCAVGIGSREDSSATPFDKRNKIKNAFPWGTTWPPPDNSGNFWSEELRPLLQTGKFPWINTELAGYKDGYATVAPVGSYAANLHGLHDLGGNVAESCLDWFDEKQNSRVMRGSDWSFVGSIERNNGTLFSSYRFGLPPDVRQNGSGFRVVLDLSKD